MAQQISGTITDSNLNKIENAGISFWDSDKKEILHGYLYSNEKGNFSCHLKIDKKEVFIEIIALNYKTVSKFINSNEFQNLNFILEIQETKIDEVIIKSEKSIREKNDTTFYEPKKFLNGTEKKIEDLIKKLPGMLVNETTGEIKYKGKSIETVKLEDDDLFGGNYSIGTKNISVEMVEQIQAIENYSSNPLLSGFEISDKVVINLKLKKQKTDYSISTYLSNGISNKFLYKDDINVLGISKKIKSFGILSFNNFGGDSNNINVFNNDFNSITSFEKEFLLNKQITENNKGGFLPNTRTNFNNTFLSNYNIIYKISKKLSVKNNFVFYTDKTISNESFSNNYILDNKSIQTIQKNNFDNKSNYFKSDMKISFNVNKKSLLITDLSFSYLKQNSFDTTTQNLINNYHVNQNSRDLFLKTKLEYTFKISKKYAMQFLSVFAKNLIPKELVSKPNNVFITGNFSNNSNQISFSDKLSLYNKFTLLSKNTRNLNQTLSLGYFLNYQLFNSNLTENYNTLSDFKNVFNYKKSNLFFNYFTSIKLNRLKFQPSFSTHLYNQNLDFQSTKTGIKENNFFIKGSIFISYEINKNTSFYLNQNLDYTTPNEGYLFYNKYLNNIFSLKNNLVSLKLIKTQNYALGYKYYNLPKQFGFNLSLHYVNNQNTFLSNIMVFENYTSFTYFQSPTNIDQKNILLSFEKRIKYLKLYFKNTSQFSINNYKNALGNFLIRDNLSENLNNSLLIFSHFIFPVEFENKFNCDFLKFKSNNQSKTENIAINNVFKLIIKPASNLVFVVSHDYFITDTKIKNDFTFLDFDLQYQIKKQKGLSFNLTGKNLLNKNTFNQINNSDYSSTIFITNLIPRSFLISTNFNF